MFYTMAHFVAIYNFMRASWHLKMKVLLPKSIKNLLLLNDITLRRFKRWAKDTWSASLKVL